jgi:cation transport regulator ChaC
VCTLVPVDTPAAAAALGLGWPDDPNACVHGAVYKVPPAAADKMMDKLTHREKAGYSWVPVTVDCADGVARRAFTFLGTPDNEYYAGHTLEQRDERTLAGIIAKR